MGCWGKRVVLRGFAVVVVVEWWSVVCRWWWWWWLQVIGPDRGGRKVQETDKTGRQSPPTETARGSPGELNANQGEPRRNQAEIKKKSSRREGREAELPSHPRDAKHRLAANTTPRLPVVLLPGPTNGSVPCTLRRRHPFIQHRNIQQILPLIT